MLSVPHKVKEPPAFFPPSFVAMDSIIHPTMFSLPSCTYVHGICSWRAPSLFYHEAAHVGEGVGVTPNEVLESRPSGESSIGRIDENTEALEVRELSSVDVAMFCPRPHSCIAVVVASLP